MTHTTKIILMVILSVYMGICNSYSLKADPKKQKPKDRHKYRTAEKFLVNGNYPEAANIYKGLLKRASRNADLNFKLGLCYLNIASEKDKSVGLLKKSIQYTKSKNNVPIDVYYNLAKAYHTNYQFAEAIKTYQDLQQIISTQNTVLRSEIQREIQICKNGLELVQNPVNISVVRLGNKINTEFSEHSPGITADEKTMVFTSRRNGTGSKIDADGQHFEDIYILKKINESWTEPMGITELNTTNHDASISISADGQELYIYRARHLKKESKGGDIYVSKLQGNEWSEPKKLGSNINSKSKENHISISADGKSIYFSSNRPGGYGGMDIYTATKLPNGKWSKAKNIGSTINSEYDDDAPFIHSDGNTLYFSSAGHKTMGGLDIFKSINVKGQWTKPVNIGYPINSTDDDICYTSTSDGKRAYFASSRAGSVGRTDIFLTKAPDANKANLFALKGKVINTKGQTVSKAVITVSRNGNPIGVYAPNTSTGKFIFTVEAEKNHKIEIVAEGYRTLRTVLNIPPEFANTKNRSVITLFPFTLRSEDEPDYPRTIGFIDFEESKIYQFDSSEGNISLIPDEEEFEETVPPEFQDTEADKTKKELELPTVEILSNDKLKKEQSGCDKCYTIQIMALKIPVEIEFFDKLDDVTVFVGDDGLTRFTHGKFKSYNKAIEVMNHLINIGYQDAFIRTIINDELLYSDLNRNSSNYTIQVMTLRYPKPLSYFKDLGNVKVFADQTTGLYRYTYGSYSTKNEAIRNLGTALKKGYWDSFVRKSLRNKPMSANELIEEEDYYTIQVMTLKNARPLNYFENLEKDDMRLYNGKDGLSRYTYQKFSTHDKAKKHLPSVIKKGYRDAFTREVKWYNEH